ncbi:MAG: ABC transporter ATP-binding protein [Oscillospiraceae bacterium]|jgi:iron complex transport system ATP-binding protein|nr:ABC transporter ATP-binding protein [Oscillospiraceae bacterium]
MADDTPGGDGVRRMEFDRISVKNLTFSYGKREVLNGLTFNAHEGEMLGLLGPNGAGKTTLFNCMLGFRNKEFKGDVLICGESVRKTPASVLATRVAYVPQSHSSVFNYSVLDMTLMGASAGMSGFGSPGNNQLESARAALQTIGIAELMHRGFMNISGGERQLVLIARALAQNAKILIMDEPTANLDFGNQIRVMTKIRELAESGYTILISTHNPEHAANYCDRVLALNHGVIAADGKPDGILTEELICSLYNLTLQQLRRNAK